MTRAFPWAGFTCGIALATGFTMVFGELVPKRIALTNPERIAAAVAANRTRLAADALLVLDGPPHASV